MAKGRKSGGKKRAAKPEKKAAKATEDPEVESEEEEEVVVKTDRKANGTASKREESKEDGSDGDAEDDEPPKAKKAKGGKATPKGNKKGRGRPSSASTKTAKKAEESDEEDPDAEYEVEAVLDTRTHKGEKHFLIKWKGFPKSKATWEPESNLDCPEKVDAYEKKFATMKEASEHELRTQPKQTKRYQDSNRNKGVRTSRRFAAQPRTTYEGMSDD